MRFDTLKNVFAFLFNVHNTISLSCHEQVCLMRLRFEGVERESRLIPRKVKETIHSLKNPNHGNKISYMLPEIWLPDLRSS